MFVGLSAHSFATIANFQWFSKLPSRFNGIVDGNHWDQWFSDGFEVRQPSVTMVFNSCAPLVGRWNGYVPSSKSNLAFCAFIEKVKPTSLLRDSEDTQERKESMPEFR